MNNRDGDRVGVKRYCARGHACWVVAVLVAAIVVGAIKLPTLDVPRDAMALGVLALVILGVSVLLLVADARSAVEVTRDGLAIRMWPQLDHFVPWEQVTGVQWRHAWWRWLGEHVLGRVQPGAHGCVELEFCDEEGRPRRETIANYIALGRPPVAVAQMIEEIATRARLTEAQRPPTVWYPRFEYAQWHKA